MIAGGPIHNTRAPPTRPADPLPILTDALQTLSALWRTIPAEVWGAAYLLWIAGSVVFMLLQRRPPTTTLAWIIGFVTLPLLGALMYFFFGPRRLRRRKLGRQLAKRLAGRMAPDETGAELSAAFAGEPHAQLARLAIRYGDTPPRRNQRLELYDDGDDTYRAIEAAMAAARDTLHLEYYIFEPDVIGRRWRDLLVERARAGVEVRVLVDALGSKRCGGRFWQPLVEAGGEVRRFNPPRLLRLQSNLINFRTHRKIVVVDGRLAFTGGINVASGHSGLSSGSTAWRDTHLSVEGYAAHDLQRVFLEDWLFAGNRDGRDGRDGREDREGRDGRDGRRGRPGRRRRDPVLSAPQADLDRWFPPLPPASGPWVQIIDSGPDEPRPSLHRFLFAAIASAQKRLWLTTPYFIPDDPMLAALATARARGVDVRLIVPHAGDSWLVSRAASTFTEEMLTEDVAVFEYQPTMIHAKTMVIDDDLTIVGTANMDNRSFRLNFEVAAAFYDPEVTARAAAMFERDLTRCRPLSVRGSRGPLLDRLVASAARLAAPLL